MATYGGSNFVTNGLVLALDAANPRSYVSGSGTWFDMSGNNYSGSLLNGPGYSTAYNGVLTFDGADDYCNSTNFALQMGNTDYTIEFVLKVNQTSTAPGIMNWGSSGPFNLNGKGMQIRFQTNLFEYTIADGFSTGIRLQYTFSNVADGTYKHYIITQIKQDLATLYLNGINVSTKSYAGEVAYTDTYNLWIARGNDGYINGNIPYVRIYNRALSSDEVLQNYNLAKLRFAF